MPNISENASKKEELIKSLKKLEMKSLSKTIQSLEKMNFDTATDLNAFLTRYIYNLLEMHPEIMQSPKSKTLITFCDQKIGPIMELRLRSSKL